MNWPQIAIALFLGALWQHWAVKAFKQDEFGWWFLAIAWLPCVLWILWAGGFWS